MELNEEWKGKKSERHVMNNDEESENNDEMEWDIKGEPNRSSRQISENWYKTGVNSYSNGEK